jgi:antagonist of KipI
MSLRIIRQGVLDTIQDLGRYGYQYLGINCNGAMDRFSAQLANALLGKEFSTPVIEIHFPSSQILFEKETIICITGADFSPSVNNQPIPLHHPVAVNKGSVLKFEKLRNGSRCYLSILTELQLDQWLNSYSTNIKAHAGGWQGRSLLKNDVLLFKNGPDVSKLLHEKDMMVLPWKANDIVDTRNEIEFIIGSEWHWLTKASQDLFQEQWFQITNEADRMGYQLAGQSLEAKNGEQLVSSAVCFGTVQLLPKGQLIILMADHQTAGGYPRVAHVISAHLPILAQKKPNDVVRFKMTSLEEAEKKLLNQKKYLNQLQIACKFRMEEFLNAHL